MLRRLLATVVLLWLILLQGCVTTSSIPELPSTLGEDGLLVARLYVPGSAAWQNASINIDGKLHGANLRDGYIAIALRPGDHNFVQLRVEGLHLSSYQSQESDIQKVARGFVYRAPTYYYSPGSSYTVYYTTLTVNRRFTIEAGKITNLGLTVYLPVPEDRDKKNAEDPIKKDSTVGKSKQYYTTILDNSAEMGRYLEVNYPNLMASVKDRAITLAPGNYLDAKKLPELRRFIASHEAKGRKFIKTATLSAVYGDAGTVVTFKPGADGKITNLQVLDTGTFADIVDARIDGERFIFLTAEAKLLVLDQGKLTQVKVPFPVHPSRLASLGNGGVAIVDNRMRILTSYDLGNNWTNYDGAMIEKPRSDIGLVSYGQGAYVYLGNRGIPSAILYLAPNEPTPRAINPPEYKQGVSNSYNTVIVREAGLFIVYYNEREFFFRSHTGQKWGMHSKPSPKCKAMDFDATGLNLKTECEGTKYESSNSGLTWTKTGGA
jgi:hypothetical protein